MHWEDTDVSEKKVTESDKKKNGLVIAMGIAVVVLLAVVVVLLLQIGKAGQKETLKEVVDRSAIVAEDNVKDLINAANDEEKVAPPYYNVKMNTEWKFADGESESVNSHVENKDTNENPVYFDVYLSDTKEVVYESPIIPVGVVNEKIKLLNSLESGTYDAVCEYHLLTDEYVDTGATVSVAVKLIVGN